MAYQILIVDDEAMLTELLSDHLQNNGYLTYVAQSSEAAIAALGGHPDLILLDINMPGMDGLALCKIIRSHVACPILFLTARITEQDKINGLQAGGDDYITKPFSLQELTARIAAHLRRDERGRQAPEIVASQGLIVNVSQRRVFYNERFGGWDTGGKHEKQASFYQEGFYAGCDHHPFYRRTCLSRHDL